MSFLVPLFLFLFPSPCYLLPFPIVLDEDEMKTDEFCFIIVCHCAMYQAEEKEHRAVEFYRGLSGGRDFVG